MTKQEMIPEGWITYRLDDFIDINPKVSLKKGEEYSFVEMKDLDASRKYTLPSRLKAFTGGSKFQNRDTLFARITPCLENGKICMVKGLKNNKGFGSTEFIILRGKERVSDNDFVYYLSRTTKLRDAAIQSMTGTSGRQRVDKIGFENIEILAPENLSDQSRIASILSSLDNKIELNLQMNKTLEAIAQAIFREWFVDFKFPGFDSELVDGLPKRWRIGTVLEIADLLSGGTPKTDIKEYWNGKIKWLSAKDITLNNAGFILSTEKSITEKGLNNSAARLLPKYTTVVSARGTVGNYCILSEEMAISQSNYGLKAKRRNSDFFLFLMIEAMIEKMKAYSYGTVFDTITTKTFKEIEVTIPDNIIIEQFNKIITPIYEKIKNISDQNRRLSQLRDTLLPKLLTGIIKAC